MFFEEASVYVTCFWQRMPSCLNFSFKSGHFFAYERSPRLPVWPLGSFLFPYRTDLGNQTLKGEWVDLSLALNCPSALFAETGSKPAGKCRLTVCLSSGCLSPES